MFNRRRFKDKDTWIMITAAIAILAFIVTMINQKNNQTLEVYNESDRVQEMQTAQTDPLKDVKMQTYQDEKIDMTLQIPEDWNYVVKSGYPTYVHKGSGASLQINVEDYDPEVNNRNAEILAANLAQNGAQYVDFQYTSNASYELMYQTQSGDATFDYIEEVYWDREHIVTLICSFNDSQYEKIFPYYEKIIDSMMWAEEDPIPEGYYLSYIADAAFEIGIPENWQTAVSGDAYVAADNETGSMMYIRVFDGGTDVASLTAPIVSGMMQAGKEGYMLSEFQASSDFAYAEALYYQNNAQYVEDVFFFSNGVLTYEIAFEYPDGAIDTAIPFTCAKLFREFLTKMLQETGQQVELYNPEQAQTQQEQPVDETQLGVVRPPSEEYAQQLQQKQQEENGIRAGAVVQEEQENEEYIDLMLTDGYGDSIDTELDENMYAPPAEEQSAVPEETTE